MMRLRCDHCGSALRATGCPGTLPLLRELGREWGTAAQIAHQLGGDVTVDMVRNWAKPKRPDRLEQVRMRDALGRPEVRYPLDQAAQIEAAKRLGGRGRARRVDDAALIAA